MIASEKISVIVPVCNAEKYLARCIDSILDQDYDNLEVILVNDGSIDHSAEIIHEYCDRDSRVRYLEQPNGGVSRARNRGLDYMTGQYVTFVDADDYVEPDYCSSMYGALKKNHADLCNVREVQHYEARKGESFAVPEDSKEVCIGPEEYSFFGGFTSGAVWGNLFCRRIVDRVRFDEDIYVAEDTLFLARAVQLCKAIVLLHRNLYHYMIYRSSGYHGEYDERKKTEYEAWKRIIALNADSPRVQETCQAAYANRCLIVIRKYHYQPGIEKSFYREMVKEYRRNLKYILKVNAGERSLKRTAESAAYLLFAAVPASYPLYYSLRYHEKS